MLAERDLDLVIVATPDHWHALPAIAAMEAGADVYVEKPISVDVVEGQAMLAAARRHGRVVQVGTQRRSTPHLVEARDDVVRSGRLGRVGHVEMYGYFPMMYDKNPPDLPPPAHLDYDLWTGPAPMRPYNAIDAPAELAGLHGVRQRDRRRHRHPHAGHGPLDAGPRRAAAGEQHRARVRAPGGKANIPDTQVATFDYGDLQVLWTHRFWGAPPDPKRRWGATLYGEKGTLHASVWGYDFAPLDGTAAVHREVKLELEEFPEDRNEKDLEHFAAPAIRRHMKDLLACRETRQRPVADIEEGCTSTTACILANLALRLGRTLEWDHEQGRVRGDEEANALLRRPYRAPWVHPEA